MGWNGMEWDRGWGRMEWDGMGWDGRQYDDIVGDVMMEWTGKFVTEVT